MKPYGQGAIDYEHSSAKRKGQKKRTSPRETIEKELRSKQGNNTRLSENVPPFITPPWWRGPRIFIVDTAEAATKEH
ncbi:hypothetical protein CCHL11_10053 [Colletotrichum chlorophyti]|uniref:Uncharacterized protein n=1 Tax=Colletotrichum chlorophyti TaxID=708187 RepID=A0A1Q8RX84_9PEZI|nr:hypothetical protein CCHL11_10053 [Colletotrichum chlorophyti]